MQYSENPAPPEGGEQVWGGWGFFYDWSCQKFLDLLLSSQSHRKCKPSHTAVGETRHYYSLNPGYSHNASMEKAWSLVQSMILCGRWWDLPRWGLEKNNQGIGITSLKCAFWFFFFLFISQLLRGQFLLFGHDVLACDPRMTPLNRKPKSALQVDQLRQCVTVTES